MCHLFPKMIQYAYIVLAEKFDTTMEATGDFQAHIALHIQLLAGLCFNLPPATAFSTSCFQEMSAPADKLISAKKDRLPLRTEAAQQDLKGPALRSSAHSSPFHAPAWEWSRAAPTPGEALTLAQGMESSEAGTQGHQAGSRECKS